MKVLVLGCGEMGSAAVRDLYAYSDFDEIIVGTRSLRKANDLLSILKGKTTKVSAQHINVEDTERLIDIFKEFRVVINCVGPNYKYEFQIAQAAIAAKIDLVDLNDEYETTLKMFDLDDQAKKAGIVIILGLGASPGANNILVRAATNQLDEVEEIHTAWVMSGADPGGLALSYHLLYSLSGPALTYLRGKLIEVQSFIDGKESIEFPDPIGTMDVYHVGHPEPITLSRSFKGASCIDNKASFNPPFINALILHLGKLIQDVNEPIPVDKTLIDPMDFAASYLHTKCKRLKGIPKEGALRVDVIGKKGEKKRRIVFTSVGRIADGTGISASVGAQLIIQGKVKTTGVLPPEECIEPDDFVFEMIDRRHVTKLNGWIEEID